MLHTILPRWETIGDRMQKFDSLVQRADGHQDLVRTLHPDLAEVDVIDLSSHILVFFQIPNRRHQRQRRGSKRRIITSEV
jgi:hypothetical protein